MTDLAHLKHRSTRRFAEVLASHGLADRVAELPESTRTAADAARGVGCDVGQIVKSLVFRARGSEGPVLFLVSGANRVDEEWVARFTGEPLARADPEFVRSASGYAIGGVPPAGHTSPIPTFVDYDLLEYPEIWAAAGHPHAVFRLSPLELLRLTRGRAIPVRPLPAAEFPEARWVTFDCYGTLVDWRAGFIQTLDRMGLGLTESDRERLFRTYLEEERQAEGGPYRPYREVMAEALVRAVRGTGGDLPLSRAFELPESVPSWPLFPDTLDALSALPRQGTRLAILSNIDRDLLERTIEGHRLSADLVVTAEEVRSYKPAPPHWVRFLKRTGASPGQVLHVSGSYEYDLETAGALGFRTAYVARYGPAPPGREVGTVLHGLGDLPPAVHDRSATADPSGG